MSGVGLNWQPCLVARHWGALRVWAPRRVSLWVMGALVAMSDDIRPLQLKTLNVLDQSRLAAGLGYKGPAADGGWCRDIGYLIAKVDCL